MLIPQVVAPWSKAPLLSEIWVAELKDAAIALQAQLLNLLGKDNIDAYSDESLMEGVQ